MKYAACHETGVPFETWKRNVFFLLCSPKLQGTNNKNTVWNRKNIFQICSWEGICWFSAQYLTTCKLINTHTYSKWKNNLVGGCCLGKKNQQVLFKPWIYGYIFLYFLNILKLGFKQLSTKRPTCFHNVDFD